MMGIFWNSTSEKMLVFGRLKGEEEGLFVDMDGYNWEFFGEMSREEAKEHIDLSF